MDAYSYFFNADNVYLNSSVYAWVFFDKHLKPLGGYIPSASETKNLNGRLKDIPANAKYVVFNQQKAQSVDICYIEYERPNTKWSGKDVLFFGDSFIDQEKLPKAICHLLGCNAINRGVSGSIVASKGGSSSQSLVDRLDGYVDSSAEHSSALPDMCDAVIINCSTNDYGTSVKMGTLEGGYADKTTFYGGMHYVIKKLVEKYPSIPIIWINAMHRNSSNLPDISIDEDGRFCETTNSVGNTLRDYVEALEEVCNLYS